MGNKSKTKGSNTLPTFGEDVTGTIFDADLSPEGLMRLRENIVKPKTPVTQEEFEDEIHNVRERIGYAKDQIRRIHERAERGNRSLVESAEDIMLEENYEFDLESLNQRLNALLDVYENTYG